MPQQKPRSVKEIFDEAAEICSPRERSAWLDEACAGDADLRAQVEELLCAYDEAGSFLEPSRRRDGKHAPGHGESRRDDRPVQTPPADRRGGHGRRLHGRADRAGQAPRVALKIIKPGMDTRQVIARFEAERQALAMMDHPNIAKVLDAGPPRAGRPYFVMELVNGIPLTEYCDEQRLTPRERLEIVRPNLPARCSTPTRRA